MIREKLLAVVVGLLITIVAPVIGGGIGYLVALCCDIGGCNGLGILSLSVTVAFLVGSFLGGFASGVLQPKGENVNLSSFLYSSILFVMLLVVLVVSRPQDIFMAVLFLVPTVLSWLGYRWGYIRKRNR